VEDAALARQRLRYSLQVLIGPSADLQDARVILVKEPWFGPKPIRKTVGNQDKFVGDEWESPHQAIARQCGRGRHDSAPSQRQSEVQQLKKFPS
jgi:hypothetical protein